MRSIHLISAFALLAASYTSVHLTRADAAFGNATQASLAEAIRLAPENAEYSARLASLLEAQGHSAEARRSLDRAAALNPYDSQIRIALGLLSESQGEFKQAERYLSQAAEVDRRYDPRWVLVNFYYRRGDADHFWLWARNAAAIAYDDDNLQGLFRLCWAVRNDGNFILDTVVPEQASVEARYLSFLLGRGQLTDATPVAQRLMAHAGPGQSAVLLEYCERLLRAGRVEEAIGIWNALSSRTLIRHPALAPDKGLSLTNGDFAAPLLKCCFDWRIADSPEIAFTQPADPLRLELRFSGRQPEALDLLTQDAPVNPSGAYRFEFEYRTAGIGFNTGVRWAISDATSGADLGSSLSLAPAEGWTTAKLRFRTPPTSRLARLQFSYRRQPGTVRIAGSFQLRNLVLRPDR